MAGQRRPDDNMSTPESKSYLASLSPWSSRSTTPKPNPAREGEATMPDITLEPQRGKDHRISHRHRLSLKSYPRDCPPLAVQWFHAVDVAKRKPTFTGIPQRTAEKPPIPRKWVSFSLSDSRAIEAAFQKSSESAAAAERARMLTPNYDTNFTDNNENGSERDDTGKTMVPVNEDFLFDVNIEDRELAPVYWLGPVYEVRRGTWFYQEGSTLRPCDENLATQLEEGYLKLKPWKAEKRTVSLPDSRPVSADLSKLPQVNRQAVAPKESSEDLKVNRSSTIGKEEEESPPQPSPLKTHRLFGAHMNSVVTYDTESVAWMETDDLFSRVSNTVYQRFAAKKLIRGYPDARPDLQAKARRLSSDSAIEQGSGDETETISDKVGKVHTENSQTEPVEIDEEEVVSPSVAQRRVLERQISSLVESAQPTDPVKQEEEARQREEKEIRDDYKEQEGDEQGRDIEHLILITHGIGQRLGLRMESVNFVHDVNTLRKTLKSVYVNSPDLQALNSEVDKMTKNCRVQVLPICWRHLLDFPKQSLKHNRKEHDLGDTELEDFDYPNLDDITVDGVPAVRNLITDLALDVLLYQSPAYKEHISRIVLQECNRTYKLFKERNPTFNGKISLIGHSLGSAIMFDLLCQQRDDNTPKPKYKRRSGEEDLKFDFEVEDFYALGSPIGLFQMLKGRTIAARQKNTVLAETPVDALEDPFSAEPSSASRSTQETHNLGFSMSSPKCKQIFNIFHPTDPISYRLEPLITPAMSALKPQPLPYTKRGILTAPVGQGLAGIGARVGQSVSGFWSSFSSGIASSLLNRSLGLTIEDQTRPGNTTPSTSMPPRGHVSKSSTMNMPTSGVGLNPSDSAAQPGGIDSSTPKKHAQQAQALAQGSATIATGDIGEHPVTLIESEIETLYTGFQKIRQSTDGGEPEGDESSKEKREWAELEEKSRRLKREEGKVRALNANGRVDYSIQEGVFEINLLASIASHLSYWADEDVSHFMISQLLSRHRVIKQT